MDTPITPETGESHCLALNLSATELSGPRTHRLDNVDYTFPPGQYIEIPLATGVQWLVPNDAFSVLHPKTKQEMRPVAAEDPTSAMGTVLQADQRIARLDELTAEALRDRAKSMPGYDQLGKNPNKETLVEFLILAETTEAGPYEGDLVDEDGDEDGDMDLADEIEDQD